LGEGVPAVQLQRAAEPVPAEPVGGLRLGADGARRPPLVLLLREAEVVEADPDAVVIAHAADAPLLQLRGEPVLEVLHDDRLAGGHDLAQLAGPEVADAELALQEGGYGVAGAVRVGGGPGVRAEEGYHLPLGPEVDAARPQPLAGEAQLRGALALADQD